MGEIVSEEWQHIVELEEKVKTLEYDIAAYARKVYDVSQAIGAWVAENDINVPAETLMYLQREIRRIMTDRQ